MSFATITSILAFIISLSTIGGYFYKAGRIRERMDNMGRELEELKNEQDQIKQQSDNDIKEIKNSINQLNIEFAKSFTELATSLNFIKDTLKGGE